MDTAKRQASLAAEEAQSALSSGAWAYPITGILYLVSHPGLLRPLIPTIVKGLIVSAVVVAGMFFLTYFPQVAALAFVSGPLAFVAAVPLVLAESYFIINYLARSLLFDKAGVDLFDAVLAQKGQSALVESGKKANASSAKRGAIGSLIGNPLSRFSTDSVIRYVLTLPLNLIPVVGTAFFLVYNGHKSGPGYHARYFMLKGYDKEKRQAAIQRRRGAYTAFGTVAMILNLIPGAAIFFNFSNAVGAALWAAKIEGKGAGAGTTPRTTGAGAKKEL